MEEVDFEDETEEEKKKKVKRRGKKCMKMYAPLIFEECYIKNGKAKMNKVANSFDMLSEK